MFVENSLTFAKIMRSIPSPKNQQKRFPIWFSRSQFLLVSTHISRLRDPSEYHSAATLDQTKTQCLLKRMDH